MPHDSPECSSGCKVKKKVFASSRSSLLAPTPLLSSSRHHPLSPPLAPEDSRQFIGAGREKYYVSSCSRSSSLFRSVAPGGKTGANEGWWCLPHLLLHVLQSQAGNSSYLDKANVGGLLSETLTADVEAVLADQTGLVSANSAIKHLSVLVIKRGKDDTQKGFPIG